MSSRPANFGQEMAQHVFSESQNFVLTHYILIPRDSNANAGRNLLSRALKDFFQEGIKARFESSEQQEAAFRAAGLYGYELSRRLQRR